MRVICSCIIKFSLNHFQRARVRKSDSVAGYCPYHTANLISLADRVCSSLRAASQVSNNHLSGVESMQRKISRWRLLTFLPRQRGLRFLCHHDACAVGGLSRLFCRSLVWFDRWRRYSQLYCVVAIKQCIFSVWSRRCKTNLESLTHKNFENFR